MDFAGKKITADTADQIITHLQSLSEATNGLEDALHLSSPDALQQQLERLLKSGGEKLKRFEIPSPAPPVAAKAAPVRG